MEGRGRTRDRIDRVPRRAAASRQQGLTTLGKRDQGRGRRDGRDNAMQLRDPDEYDRHSTEGRRTTDGLLSSARGASLVAPSCRLTTYRRYPPVSFLPRPETQPLLKKTTVIASRAPHLLLEQRIVDVHRPSTLRLSRACCKQEKR